MTVRSSKAKIPMLEMAKWLLIALLAIFIFFQLSSNHESSTSFDAMKDAVLSSADLSGMQESDNIMLKRLYGLDSADYEGVLLYTPTTNMGAEELLLVKLTDRIQQDTVVSAVQHRIETQKNNFEGYGVTQFAMLENCVLEVQGNYILLVVASNPHPVKQAFLDAL